MCVIVYSPKHTDIPTDKQLEDMWNANPDGAGYAYISRGRVHYKKGFMTLAELKADLTPQREAMKNREFALHFRIGTAGKNDAHTTHPFPISTNFGELRKTEGTVESVLFHNGVLDKGGISNPLASDTQDFVIAFAPLLAKPSQSKTRDHFIEDMVQGNRLLLFYGTGRVKKYGEWQKDGDLLVSNTVYKHRYTSYKYTDEFDGWWRDYYTHKVATPTEEEVADSVLENVAELHYSYTSPEEMKALKAVADKVATSEMWFGDQVIGYDESALLVWEQEKSYSTPTNEYFEDYERIYG